MSRHLEALNLHESGGRNEFMKAFGVKISQKPLEVTANRVKLPSITFAGNKFSDVDRDKVYYYI
ncbi:unnamed protein product [Anisakis simplex]|uniref:ABC transporter ATP-binding protein n=1 Tax=Anisakis simplex TaxID=6269 RepID=A0A0M3JQH8_ANISI|nr:unnamed protein product [Anisakis simplex]